MTTIFVSGAIANKHGKGGSVWTRLSYALGLKRLGFRVYFVEQIEPGACIAEDGTPTSFEGSANLDYFRQVVEHFGLAGTAALVYADGARVWGMPYDDLLDVAEDAALLVNISGHLTLEPLLRRLRRKAYVDQDPGFTQLWHAAGSDGPRLAGHDVYFSVGENIGTSACRIPTGEIAWRPTRQPVVLEQWPVTAGGDPLRLTTIASWRGPYGPVEYAGTTFGLKVHEFRKFVELPERIAQSVELALDIHPGDQKDLDLLRRHGWQIADPARVVPDPLSFRSYVQSSGAEFSVAQGVYVQTGSGWFSDRTTRYLATGRPALVQDTGFSRTYPTGDGLIPFTTLEEAVVGAETIARDYQRHSRAARALAEAYFDSDIVLARLVAEADVSP